MGVEQATAENMLTELTQGLQTRPAGRCGGAGLGHWSSVVHPRETQLNFVLAVGTGDKQPDANALDATACRGGQDFPVFVLLHRPRGQLGGQGPGPH